jgi:hypothetical protein
MAISLTPLSEVQSAYFASSLPDDARGLGERLSQVWHFSL